jgi:hypothetical protein
MGCPEKSGVMAAALQNASVMRKTSDAQEHVPTVIPVIERFIFFASNGRRLAVFWNLSKV